MFKIKIGQNKSGGASEFKSLLPGNFYWRRRISTVGYLVLSGPEQLLLILKTDFSF
jgi:hypothetical protein